MDKSQDSALYYIYIGNLLFKESEKEPLSAKEQQDLNLWRSDPTNQQETYDRKAVIKELRYLNEKYSADDAVKHVFKVLQLKRTTLQRIAGNSKLWVRSLSAAAAIILLFIGTWFIINRKEVAKPPVAASYKKDISAGKDKATLTLADGTKITLDSAKNGEVALQGDARIVKRNGQLAYNTNGSGASAVFNIMQTPRGGQYQLLLPDGTKVWLNAASSIRYPTVFSDKERKVELNGEAYFDVAQNKSKPFIVKSGDLEVTVLGTQFNVMAYEDEVTHQTTLVEGKVLLTKDHQRKELHPGEQGIVNDQYKDIVIDKHADIDKAIAWRAGFFKFSNTDIKTLMREISRWYDVEVVYEISDFSGTYGGRINRNLELSELIKLLQGNGIHHYRIEGRRIIVLP